MPILPVHIYGKPALRKKAKPVQSVDADLLTDIANMFETMHNAHGIGLAGNQVGILRRVIVVDLSDMEEERSAEPMAMINPEVVEESGKWTMEEGCLSIPDVRDDVERAETIRVRYRDLEFREKEIVAGDLLARVILHEIDHLNGVLFIDRIGSVKQKLLKGRLNRLLNGEIDVPYPIAAEPSASIEVQK
jgi:peptide deformylase